ncbi:ribosome hibernation-promoting factor, HPF/YfiA family [Tenacibaculum sp. MEBiC06402]|uniref:ribosome hibernation-promoting factor, HPF/YfiA family n=1 Tax=unclassified Tenacibaculum TaxID=2635139 RepID=UPI003B9B9A41
MADINIQFIRMNTSENLEEFILKKLEKITKFYQNLIDINVYIKYENSSENKGRICEVEMKQPGFRLFASADENDYQVAVTKAVDQIKRQLDKHKAA